MTVPYTFGTATTSIPLSNLDANFNTPITLGNTSIYLGNTTTTIGNLTLTNVTISSGTANITSNITYATANAVVYSNSSSIGTTNSNLTWNGTNFGIGTSSPGAALESFITSTSTPSLRLRYNSTSYYADHLMDGNGSYVIKSPTANGVASGTLYLQSGSEIWFSTNGNFGASQQMRLDSSGNLGLGVTPSAWASSPKAFQIGTGGGAISAFSNEIDISLNSYYNGGYKYVGTGKASLYFQFDGQHVWNTAASGTAGNAITFTQAMTLNASSNLGIGTTSPTGRLDVVYDSALVGRFYSSGGRGIVRVDGLTDSSFQAYKNGSLVGFLQTDGGGTELITGTSGAFPYYIYTNNTAKVTVTSAGNVGIGTSSPSYILDIQKTASAQLRLFSTNNSTGSQLILGSGTGTGTTSQYVYFDNSLIFSSAGVTDRVAIDSSGNVLVGTTTGSGAQLRVHTSQSSVSYMQNSAASPNGLQIYYSTAVNSVANEFLFCNDVSVPRMTVRSNGGIANYSANDVNLSDRREKTNFAPACSYLNKICAIPVQTFNYIDQNLEQDGGLTLGVVAQDVQAIAPELVMESNWANKDAEPKMRLSIYQTDLQYALMKCIQEQQALIESLTTRLTALENK